MFDESLSGPLIQAQSSHLLHPELFFILKKSTPSKGNVNTNVVNVSINVQ